MSLNSLLPGNMTDCADRVLSAVFASDKYQHLDIAPEARERQRSANGRFARCTQEELERYLEAVRRMDAQGLGAAEIAFYLNCSASTAKRYLKRVRDEAQA